MLNIPEYKEYAGETKIALMDNSSLAFMHELHTDRKGRTGVCR